MAAVLVDKLSGNGLLHDLLHLQDAQGVGETDQMGCCAPGPMLYLQHVHRLSRVFEQSLFLPQPLGFWQI